MEYNEKKDPLKGTIMAALYYVVFFAIMLIPTGFICKYYDRMEDREIEREARRNEKNTIHSSKN